MIEDRVRAKAMSRIHMLGIRIDELELEIQHAIDNALISKETLEVMLSGAKRDLELWEFILRLTDEKENNKG